MTHATKPRNEARVAITLKFLALAQTDLLKARTVRLQYAHLGRSHGMTYGEIAIGLGVTEAAARTLIKRNPENAS